MFRISVCVCAFALLACCVLPLAAQPMATTFYGCVNNATGGIRIVTASTTCKSTEHKIQWNQVGPQGPQGPQGPKGAQGAQGPQGPAGISVGNSALGSSGALNPFPGSVVAQTNSVPATGVYYIAASALLDVASGDGVYCYTTTGSNGGGVFDMQAGSNVAGFVSTAPSDAIFIGQGDVFQLWCYTATNNPSSFVYDAALTSTLINSSFAPKKQRHSQMPPSTDPSGPQASK